MTNIPQLCKFIVSSSRVANKRVGTAIPLQVIPLVLLAERERRLR
jgi:hypothetical protein